MQTTVGTTATELNTNAYPDLGASGQTVLVQNLGPGILYVDFRQDVTVSTGLRLSPDGDAYEFQRASGQKLFAVASEADTDVRFLAVG